jgi:hypothetical protein
MKKGKNKDEQMLPVSFRVNEKTLEDANQLKEEINKQSPSYIPKIEKSTFYRIVFMKGLEQLKKSMVVGSMRCEKCGKRIAVTVPRHLRERLEVCTCKSEAK